MPPAVRVVVIVVVVAVRFGAVESDVLASVVLPPTSVLKCTTLSEGRAIGSYASMASTVSNCRPEGETAREVGREDGRKPLPRNGDMRPVVDGVPAGLWARDGPILKSFMMAKEDFLCMRG